MKRAELITKLKSIDAIKNSSSPEYLDKNIVLMADKIEKSREDIRSAIEDWLTAGEEKSLEIEGVDYKDLIEKAGMIPIAAYLTLDWVARDPKQAKFSLKAEYNI